MFYNYPTDRSQITTLRMTRVQNVLHNWCNVLTVNVISAPAGGGEIEALAEQNLQVLLYFFAISEHILITDIDIGYFETVSGYIFFNAVTIREFVSFAP